MRYSQVLSLSAVLLAGLAFSSVNTAQAGGGDDNRLDSRSSRSDSHRDRHTSRRDESHRGDRYRRGGRYDNSRHNNHRVVIKERKHWDVGDALLYHFGRTVINDVFQTPRHSTRVVVRLKHVCQSRYDMVWIEPVYEYRRNRCGQIVKVCVRAGFYKKVWISATRCCETGYH